MTTSGRNGRHTMVSSLQSGEPNGRLDGQPGYGYWPKRYWRRIGFPSSTAAGREFFAQVGATVPS
jgi:hypothetical protein